MDESNQKMEALKKAYADIIFNTTQEAAAKIIVAERRASQCQKEKFESKQEALNMLVQLKTIMDSKIGELEFISLYQKRKIGELEAQVSKAEVVATDLRAELKEVKEELEKMKNSRMQHLDEGIAKESAPSSGELKAQVNKAEGVANDLREELKGVKEELEKLKNSMQQHLEKGLAKASAPPFSGEASQGKQPVASESFVYYPWTSGHVPLSFSKANANWHQKHTTDRCSLGPGNVSLKNGRQDNSPEDNCSSGNPTLSSMTRIVKKPHLYRPGCTQRIHAIQRSPLNENLCPSPHVDNLSSHKQNTTRNVSLMQNNQTRLEGLFEKGNNCDKVQDVKCLEVPSSRRGSGSRKASTSPCSSQIMKSPVGTDNSITESSERRSRNAEETDNRASEFTSMTGDLHSAADIVKTKSSQNASNGDKIMVNESDLRTQENQDDRSSEVPELILNHKKFQAPQMSCTVADVLITENGDKMLIDQSDLTTQEKQSTKNSEIPESALNGEKKQVPLMRSDIKDAENCGIDDGTPTEDVDHKHHKFTVRRKRKRTSLRRCDELAYLEKNTLKKKQREVQSNVPEPPKSSLTVESSRDDRRLMLVARQLISLKDKKF